MFEESSAVELKERLNDKFEKSVVGFLNSNGGNLYIGIGDNSNIIGVTELDSTLLQIKNRIIDNIAPSTIGLFDISVIEIDSKSIINITIARGSERPYYLKAKGMSPEGCFIKVANSTMKMPIDMITSLFSKRTRTSLKNIISPIQQLTFIELKIYYSELKYEINDNLLKQLDLYNDDGKYNYLAYLLSDNNRLSFKVAKYRGKDVDELIENEEYGNGCLIKVTKNILAKLEIENRTFTKITYNGREEIKMIDSIALKEAVINAIIHNDYCNEYPPKFELFEDRLEIVSTGGLNDNFAKEDFLGGFSAPRNKEIMRVFKDLRLVEHLGTGIRKILKVYDKDIFEFYPNFIKVTFKFKENEFDLLDRIRSNPDGIVVGVAIIKEMKANPRVTMKELAKKIKVSDRTILRYTNDLVENKIISRIGSRKTGYWYVN